MGGQVPSGMLQQAIGAVLQAGNYDLVVLQYFHVILGEDGDTVVVVELTHGYE